MNRLIIPINHDCRRGESFFNREFIHRARALLRTQHNAIIWTVPASGKATRFMYVCMMIDVLDGIHSRVLYFHCLKFIVRSF